MIKLLTNFIFLVALVSFINSARLSQGMPDSKVFPQEPENWLGPKLKIKPSRFVFSVDDAIIQFYVNNNKVPFQFTAAQANTWDFTKTMKVVLYAGDVLRIVGKDINKGNCGLIGTLYFINKVGVEKIYHTGPGWFCDGKPAVLKDLNDGKANGFPYIKDVDKSARWIWNSDLVPNGREVACTFEIPC